MSRLPAPFPSVHLYPPNAMYNTHPVRGSAVHPLPVPGPMMAPNAYHNVLSRRRSRSKVTQKTIVIFDWDDTLFPTSSVVCQQEKHITVGDLQNLGRRTYELLGKYIDVFGANNVFIVTNGSKTWVLDSLKEMSRVYQVSFEGVDDQQERKKDYWAALYNSLISLQLKIFSAKALYAEDHPQQPTLWKTLVFKSIVKEHFNLYSGSDNNIYCIISIGDSENEFMASYEAKQMIATMNRLNRNNNIARLHRIKLKEEPTMKEMVNQIASLMKEADTLHSEQGSITIRYLQERRGDKVEATDGGGDEMAQFAVETMDGEGASAKVGGLGKDKYPSTRQCASCRPGRGQQFEGQMEIVCVDHDVHDALALSR